MSDEPETSDGGGVADLIVRCLENEGVTHVFGIPGEENIHLVEALSRSSIRYVLVRHEQAASFMAEVYGRLTGKAGRVLGDARPGRDQPAARRGRRDDELDAGRGAVGAGRDEPQVQGIPPGRRPGLDVRAGDEVVGADRHAGRRARDDPQGVQARADRAARRRLPGGPRGRREGPRPRGREAAAWSTSPARTSPRPASSRAPPTSCARPRNPILLAGHGAARAGAGDARAPLRRDARHPGGHHVPRQGRPPRRPSAGARRGRLHAPRLRELRLRPGRRDHRRRLRAAGVRPGSDQPATATRRSSTSTASRPRSTLHYEVEVGLQSDIARTLDALAGAVDAPLRARARRAADPRDDRRRARARPGRTTGSRSRRRGSSPTRAPRCGARTSCSSTPGR